MAVYLFQASICMVLLYGIYHLLLQKETFFNINRAYLIGSLVVSMIIPWIATHMQVAPSESLIAFQVFSSQIFVVDSSPNIHPSFDIWHWIWRCLYVAGIILVLAKLIYGLSKIYTLYHTATIAQKSAYTLVTTQSAHLPFSFFHYVFISNKMPFDQHLETILDHEQVHIKQHHTVDILLVEVIQAIFWFNPVLILYKKAIRQSHEYIADATICEKQSVSSYTDLLLHNTQKGLEMSLPNHFFNSQIKKRIIMMTSKKSNKNVMWKYAILLPVVIGLVLSFARCKDIPSPSDPPAAPEAPAAPSPPVPPDESILSESEEIYKAVQEMPRFPGCENNAADFEKDNCAKGKMLEYIYKNMKYPEEARINGIEGQVVAQFIVSKKGELEEIKILRDIGEGCGDEVLRVLTAMNNMSSKWRPGRKDGRPVNVLYTLPIKFKLEGDAN